jgi:hypothetical protein
MTHQKTIAKSSNSPIVQAYQYQIIDLARQNKNLGRPCKIVQQAISFRPDRGDTGEGSK